jgi:hypothetical protein
LRAASVQTVALLGAEGPLLIRRSSVVDGGNGVQGRLSGPFRLVRVFPLPVSGISNLLGDLRLMLLDSPCG